MWLHYWHADIRKRLRVRTGLARVVDAQIRAIADPTRRRILQLSAKREFAAGEIATRFQISRPGVSRHIRVLLDAGLLSVRREATRRYYRANAQGLALLRDKLDTFWERGLADLKRVAEGEAKRR